MDRKIEDLNLENIMTTRTQNLMRSFTKCKTAYISCIDEVKKLRETNAKLDLGLKTTRELEEFHRYDLQTSRQMIGSLQETVSQLVYLKTDTAKLKEELSSKDITITNIEKEKEELIQKHKNQLENLKHSYVDEIKELKKISDNNIKQVRLDADTQLAQYRCTIEELQLKLKEQEDEYTEKAMAMALEYEEKMRCGKSQVTALQDQLGRQAAHLEAYRKRVTELDEKLKETQFKHYLNQYSSTQSSSAQFEYPTVEKNKFTNYGIPSRDTKTVVTGYPKTSLQLNRKKDPSPSGTLQVHYYEAKPPDALNQQDAKGLFCIKKKRKLYTEKNDM